MMTLMKSVNPSVLCDDPLLYEIWRQLGKPRRCHVTGGHVRDRLLGRTSNDLDLTIEGHDDQGAGPVRQLGKALGARPHLLGTAPHRIWRVETNQIKIEVWPLGELSHEEDIRRRDFTCNALAWKLPGGPLTDLVGGLDDLGTRRLRAVSRENLEDDPVRLIRGPRFLAQLEGFEFESRTREWIRELGPMLATSPRERVGQELLTLLRAPEAARGLGECLDLGLFEPAAPEPCTVDTPWLMARLMAMDALNARRTPSETHALSETELPFGAGVPPARDRTGEEIDAAGLALLFRAWGLPSERDLAPYSWPKPVRDNALRAACMLDEALATVGASPAERREIAWRAGPAFPALISLAENLDPRDPGWTRWRRQWRRNPAALLEPQPLLSGLEISEITGVDPGPELGRITRALLRAQVRGEIRSRGGALRWLTRQMPPR